MFDTGRNCWRVARADRLAMLVDAQDYFHMLRHALLEARQRVMLVGWDFDGRISFRADEREPAEPETIGDFLFWLVERSPDLQLYLLRWDVGAIKSAMRGSTLLTVLKWMRHPRIHLKLDGHHPTGSSHHQKIVSIDDTLAFCGGIDMTAERWDTRAHRDGEPGRKLPNGKPYKPWHDATSALAGPVAGVLARECRDRWERATGVHLEALDGAQACWPAPLAPTLTDIDVAVARTRPAMGDQEPVHEVEALFLDQIAAARRVLYCESQYFASRRVAEAIARRLDEPDGPEIVIVNPLTAQGWLEPLAMDTARARLVEALRARDRHGRFAIYHPFTAGGEAIYVHAKITIVDDRQLRIGSANINNRSLRLDTECDVAIAARDAAYEATIAGVRADLLAEHLGVAVARVGHVFAQEGSLIRTIDRLRGPGRSLVPYEVPGLDAVRAWLADHELLDPESPDEMFEPLSRRSLFRGLRAPTS